MVALRHAWEVGDLLSSLTLLAPDGRPFDFLAQSIGGRTRVLLLRDAMPDAAFRAELTAAAERLQAMEADLHLVICGSAPAPVQESFSILHDPAGRLPGLLGLPRPAGLFIVDHRDKVALVDAQGDPGMAIAACERLHLATPDQTLRWAAPVLLIENVVEPPLCRHLIDYWEQGAKVADRVAAQGQQRAANSIKRRSDVYIENKELFEGLKQRIGRRVIPEIRRAFAFEVTRFEALRIGCYDSANQGFFARHRDNRTKFTAHRRFAMTLNLNTGAYEGGELRFPEFGRQLYQAGAGGAVIFSCSLLHEALPVRSGRRFGLFTFLYDEAGAEIERRNKLAENNDAAVDLR